MSLLPVTCLMRMRRKGTESAACCPPGWCMIEGMRPALTCLALFFMEAL